MLREPGEMCKKFQLRLTIIGKKCGNKQIKNM